MDLVALLTGLVLMLVVNGLLAQTTVRAARAARRADGTADVLRGGQRLPVDSSGEIRTLERAFNNDDRAAGDRAPGGRRATRCRRRRTSANGWPAACTTRSASR